MRKRGMFVFGIALILLAGASLYAQSSAYKAVLRWVQPTFYPLHLAVNATGTHAAVRMGYNLVGWLNLDRGVVERVIPTRRFPLVAIEMRQNRLLIADQTRTTPSARPVSQITIWDVSAWQKVQEIGVNTPLIAAALSPNGAYAAAVGRDRWVRVWRISDGALVMQAAQAFVPTAVVFAADGTRIVTCDVYGYLRMWSLSGTYLGSIRIGWGGAQRLANSPDGNWLILGMPNSESRALGFSWQAGSIGWYAPYNGGVTGIAFAPNTVFIGSTDANLYQHHLATGQRLQQLATRTSVQSLGIADNHSVLVAGCFHFPFLGNFPFNVFPDYNLALVEVWSPDGTRLRQLYKELTRPMAVHASQNGAYLAAGDFEGNLYLMSKANGAIVNRFPGHADQVRSVALSASGRYLASCSMYEAKLWDVQNPATPVLLYTFTPLEPGIVQVHISPDDQKLAVVSRSGLYVLERATGALLFSIQGSEEERFVPECAAFSPDSQTIAVGGRMNSVLFYNATTGDLIGQIETAAETLGLQYSADAARLLINEDRMRVVDLASGADVAVYESSVEKARFVLNDMMVVALRVANAYLWDYSSESELSRVILPFDTELLAYSEIATEPGGRIFYTSFANHGIAAWFLTYRADVNGDGCVDDADLLEVLFAFGSVGSLPADVNEDGTVDDADLLEVLFNFGNC